MTDDDTILTLAAGSVASLAPGANEAAHLGLLMPMFLWVDQNGIIGAAGPTMSLICAGKPLIGASFWEVFAATRHRSIEGRALARLWGGALHLCLRNAPATRLRALVVPARRTVAGHGIELPVEGAGCVPAGDCGSLLNFSFGIDLSDAIRRHGLSGTDFAPTDLAMELLYLQEAKTVVMRELQALNGRLEDARRAAEAQALADPLTGLANRRALELALNVVSQEMANGGPGFALAHLDLDRFKQVNDTCGHAAGDRVLVRVAQVLRDGVRRNDLAARVGGDEFVLLLRGMTDDGALRDFGARLISRIEAPIDLGDSSSPPGQKVGVSASIGFALPAPGLRPDPDRLLSLADGALYASKRRGRARCTVRRMRADGTVRMMP